MDPPLLLCPLMLDGCEASAKWAVLFVREDMRDDSQEWYTEWRAATGDW
jgi:hypothetical protein